MTDENIPAGLPREAAPARWLIGFAVAVAGLTLYSHLAGRCARKRVPPDGGFLDVDDTRIHYSDTGQRPVIVMVHGLGGQMRNFSYALTARLADRYRVILVDRPGAGYSSAQAGAEPSLAGQARIIAGTLRQLGLVRPLVVGHFLGGAVALTLALDNPGLLGGLALIAPLTQTPNVHPMLKTSMSQSCLLHHLIGCTSRCRCWSRSAVAASRAGCLRRSRCRRASTSTVADSSCAILPSSQPPSATPRSRP